MFQTSVKCDWKLFNTASQPEAVTKYIYSLRQNLLNSIADLTAQGTPLTADTLKRVIQRGGVNSYTLKDLYDDFNKILNMRQKAGKITLPAKNKYILVQNLFSKDFPLDRQVSDITPAVIETFYHKQQSHYQDSSLSGIMTRLKTIVRYALDNAHLKINPFQNLRISKGNKAVITFTEEDLEKIRNKTFPQRLQKVADFLIFAAGSGISYIDCINLQPEDFLQKNGKWVIIKNRHKTNIPFYSVLLPWAVEIMNKYDKDFSSLKISNQKVNKYLKEIGKICDISIPLHFHLSRHFYCTYLINHKIPISVIAKAVGHCNNSMITQHYSHLLSETVIDEIGSLF